MKLTPAKKVLLIFLLTAAAASIALPKKVPFKFSLGPINIDKVFTRRILDFQLGPVHINTEYPLVLGLDLAGGSHLVFEADTSALSPDRKAEALTSLKEVIERRVNLFGISEPSVQTSSFEAHDRIIVELPGVNDTQSAIGLIGQTASLTFAELNTPSSPSPGTQVVEDQPLYKPTDLTGADLKSARVSYDNTTGKPVVSIVFTQEGGEKFAKLTEANVGKPLPILLDNQLVTAPIVQDKITGGQAQISGDFTNEAAQNLAIQLNAGALPVPVKIVEQRVVGATLGEESIQKSLRAGIVGLVMVALFMILAYRRLGVIAVVALGIFGILTLALYKLLPVVLTLPGIAGFLLSIGMAVDSNILIFERYKEEIKRRDVQDALEVSFGRAWDSIKDANVATLVTAFMLANPLDLNFLHTSGPVRGFAITLALGIFISLFTGIIVSRNLLRVFVRDKSTSK